MQSQSKYSFVIALICFVQGFLLWRAADKLSPNPDEFAHLVAGVSYWRTGDVRLYSVNPPLVRLVASFPLILLGAQVPLLETESSRTTRNEFVLGRQYIEENQQKAFQHLVVARRTNLLLIVPGTLAVILLGELLTSRLVGILAGLIWAFNPITLGYSPQLGCDIPSATVGAWALLGTAIVLERPSWKNTTLAGLTLGLAVVTKNTWLVAALAWPIGFFAIWYGLRFSVFSGKLVDFAQQSFSKVGLQCMVIALIVWIVVVFAYRGKDVFVSLNDYTFVSKTLAGDSFSMNRFRGYWAGQLPVPLPRTFVEGLDQQWEDFDRPRWAYLFGQWQLGGWVHYYLAALLVKMPLGWIILLSASYRHVLRDPRLLAMGVGLPLLFVVLVSTKTNMNEHVRYLWIALPMLAIVAAIGIAKARTRLTQAANGLMCFWILIAGATTYPFGISYANELFGGPRSISKYLAASGVDWSQGWVAARDWIQMNRTQDQVIGIVQPNWYPLSVVGIHLDLMVEREVAFDQIPTKAIFVLVSTHDRMEMERQNLNAFTAACKVELIGYCIEVYEFPYSERFRIPRARPILAQQIPN